MQLNYSTRFVSVIKEDGSEVLININNISYVLVDECFVRLIDQQGGGESYFKITPQSCKDLAEALKS